MKLVHHFVLTDVFAVQDHLPKIVIMGLLVQGGWLVHFNLLLDNYENDLERLFFYMRTGSVRIV